MRSFCDLYMYSYLSSRDKWRPVVWCNVLHDSNIFVASIFYRRRITSRCSLTKVKHLIVFAFNSDTFIHIHIYTYSNLDHMFVSTFSMTWLFKQHLAMIQAEPWERGLLFLTVCSCRVEDEEDLWWVEHDTRIIVHLKRQFIKGLG